MSNEKTPLLSDEAIEQHTGGYLSRSNMPESVHRRRTEDLATGMRLARLFYEVNPGAVEADRAALLSVVRELVGKGGNLSHAMSLYEMDVDEDPPFKHRKMMDEWADLLSKIKSTYNIEP